MAQQSRGEGLAELRLVFYRSAWWLGLLSAGLLQSWADITPLSIVPGTSTSGLAVSLGWTPSPSPSVTGYFLNWGLVSGQCTNQLDVGNVTNTTLSGLTAGVIYYFTVVAYDAAGDQAPPSNELAYSTAPPTLSLQPFADGTNPSILSLSIQGLAGENYVVEATQDFLQWVTVWTTNCVVSGPLVYTTTDPAIYPQRFYRVSKQ